MDAWRGVSEDGHPVESLVVFSPVGEHGPELVDLPEGAVVSPVEDADRYGSLSKQDLVTECGSRWPPLSTAGSKTDLVARLREADAAPIGQAPDEPPVEESP